MSPSTNPIFLCTAIILVFNLASCTEFVPAYIWGTLKTSEHVPALHKISEDSFKDTILEYLKRRPYIVVFAEHTLSPEDFSQRDQAGNIAFENIYSLKESSSVTYRPYVQNPIGAIKQLDNRVTEVSISSLLNNSPSIDRDNILIVDLNDAKDDEHRLDMLKRHDSAIVAIYNEILQKHQNVLAIYTAHHTSWVAPQEITRRKSRSLLADEEEEEPAHSKIWKTDSSLLYISDTGIIRTNNANLTINDWTASKESNENEIVLTLEKGTSSLVFSFMLSSSGYWFLEDITVNIDSKNTSMQRLNIYAPRSFSYHCTKMVLKGTNVEVDLPGFQIQPFFSNQSTFGDAYDCVGFTSIPIWSGLFVTAILLLIMTFGLTMMMDIKTMDRFDDAKGKTITINVSE